MESFKSQLSPYAARTAIDARELLPYVPHIVGITTVAWRFPIARVFIYPIKLISTIVHEVGHVVAGNLEGHRCITYSADPHKGGETSWHHPSGDRGRDFYPEGAVPAGYAFNLLAGSALIYSAFDSTLAWRALVAVTSVLGISTLYYDNINTVMLPIAWLVFCFKVLAMTNARWMQTFVFTLGIVSNSYMLLDVLDEKLWGKQRPSCISLHAKWLPLFTRMGWIANWTILSVIATGAALKAGSNSVV